MVQIQTPSMASDQVTDQPSTSELLKKISDLTAQLSERDTEIDKLRYTLEELDTSRNSSVCRFHFKRKRCLNSTDLDRNSSLEVQDPPKCEEPINPLLPPHFSETWFNDHKYTDEWTDAVVCDMVPFVVLAERTWLEALGSDTVTAGIEARCLGLPGDDIYDISAFYGIFLGDIPYSKDLDARLHEIMESVATKYGVQPLGTRYMVWNDNIEEEYWRDTDTFDLNEMIRTEVRASIFREAGLRDPCNS